MRVASVCKVVSYDKKHDLICLKDKIVVDVDKMIPGTEMKCTKDGKYSGITFCMYKKDIYKEYDYKKVINKVDTTYLIEQDNFYKIGFTKNLQSRIESYETHNANFKVIGYILRNEEKDLQEKFKSFCYKNEWFYKKSEILKEFVNRGMIKYNKDTFKNTILNYIHENHKEKNEIIKLFLSIDEQLKIETEVNRK